MSWQQEMKLQLKLPNRSAVLLNGPKRSNFGENYTTEGHREYR